MPKAHPRSSIQASDRSRAKWSSQRRWRAAFFRLLWLWQEKGTHYAFKRALLRLGNRRLSYANWIKNNDTLTAQDLLQISERIEQLPRLPLITLVLLIEDPIVATLKRVIDSVQGQLYENWQLYIANHSLNAPEVRALLTDYAGSDARIRLVANEVCGMAHAGNAALAAATGEFIGLLREHDRLAPHALYLIIEEINSCPNVNLIYTDEDIIDSQAQRSSPSFKTEWNPDLILSQNYIGHLVVFRGDLIKNLGFRAGLEGYDDYDLVLRAIEQIPPTTIRHVPYVLVHRELPSNKSGLADGNALNAQRALRDHLGRLGIGATVEPSRNGKYFRVRRISPNPLPRVSIIIPTRDHVELLRGAVESILSKTRYSNYELVIVDNQSVDVEALAYLDHLSEITNIRVLHFDDAFNHSAINNFAAKHCQSPVLAFLNNDVQIIDENWLGEMVSQAVRPEVGVVGAMLYYPDDTIQHAGIILGFGGVAANCYSGLNRNSAGYLPRVELIQNCSAVTAACLLTRADVFALVGGFNADDLPVAFNDVDYCLRLRERGYLVTWTPYAELYHFESVSRGDDMSPSKIDRFRRDQAYMAKRWGQALANDPYYNPNLSFDSVPFTPAAVSRLRRPWKPGL